MFVFYIDRKFVCNHYLLFFFLACKLWKSGLWIIHYIRYTIIFYIGIYLVLTCKERFLSAVCCFFSNICWSVNFMNWVSKFRSFRHARKLRLDLYLKALVLWKFQFQLFGTCSTFFICSVNRRDFFGHFASQ